MVKWHRTDAQLAAAIRRHKARQDAARGAWPDPRVSAQMPHPPFPDPENPVLDHLVRIAEASMRHGEDRHLTLMHSLCTLGSKAVSRVTTGAVRTQRNEWTGLDA